MPSELCQWRTGDRDARMSAVQEEVLHDVDVHPAHKDVLPPLLDKLSTETTDSQTERCEPSQSEIERATALGCRLQDLLVGKQLRKAVTARSLGEAAEERARRKFDGQ